MSKFFNGTTPRYSIDRCVFSCVANGWKKKKSRRRLERDKSRFNKARRLSRVHISRILGKPRVPFHLSARIPFVHYPSFHSFTTPYVLILIAFSRRIPRHFSPSPSALSSFFFLIYLDNRFGHRTLFSFFRNLKKRKLSIDSSKDQIIYLLLFSNQKRFKFCILYFSSNNLRARNEIHRHVLKKGKFSSLLENNLIRFSRWSQLCRRLWNGTQGCGIGSRSMPVEKERRLSASKRRGEEK